MDIYVCIVMLVMGNSLDIGFRLIICCYLRYRYGLIEESGYVTIVSINYFAIYLLYNIY